MRKDPRLPTQAFSGVQDRDDVAERVLQHRASADRDGERLPARHTPLTAALFDRDRHVITPELPNAEHPHAALAGNVELGDLQHHAVELSQHLPDRATALASAHPARRASEFEQ
jgi:hypothetical protein